jgi:hypothetical protein
MNALNKGGAPRMNSIGITPMSYIASPWNHFRAVRAWAGRNSGRARIDLATFQVEIRAFNRYFTLHPQFFAKSEGRSRYVSDVSADDIVGFAGWLPYRPVQWNLSTDKMAFDAFARRHALRRPAVWGTGTRADQWHVEKALSGSFGEQVTGPFPPESPLDARVGDATRMREAFVVGRNLKVWFWGSEPFFAHLHELPSVLADGARPLRLLLGPSDPVDTARVAACLAFQGLTAESVPPAGKRVWTDFRYGRGAAPRSHSSASDDDLPATHSGVRAQIESVGTTLWGELSATFHVPLLYSVDGILDRDLQVWWLEANANPALPPEGYPRMLDTLFPSPRGELSP